MLCRTGLALAALLLSASCTALDSNLDRDRSLVEAGVGPDGALGAGPFGDAAATGGTGGAGAIAPGAVDTGLGTPCLGEGTTRCSAGSAGARQVCTGGAWAVLESCPSGQICQQNEGAAPSCQAVAEVCKGSAGAAVCDGQGTLFSCNADGTVAAQQSCGSSKLCQLGLSTKQCAACVPNTEFKCTGALLEVCAPDGLSFVRKEMCATEALCNKLAGMCTTGACAPGKIACSGNTLTECNSDGSAFKSQMACPTGSTCDDMGGDCNVCEPGMKKCENGMVLTCDALGHGFTASACSGSQHCVGAGQCAACGSNDDCSAMTAGCKVGVCGTTNTCSTMNAAAGTTCTAANSKPGTCSNGSCVCTPQCAGKMCGDDGCGGQCPSQCSFTQSCSSNKCIDCKTNSDCSGSFDGCKVGMCTNGVCSQVNASSTTKCQTLSGSGTCSAGSCQVCQKTCGTNPTSCGSNSDGCGGACTCTGGKECRSGTCALALYAICTTPAGISSECGSTVGDQYGCFALAGNRPFCVSAAPTCPSGTEHFGSNSAAPCLVACDPSAFGGCPPPFAKCQSVYDGVPTPAYCVR